MKKAISFLLVCIVVHGTQSICMDRANVDCIVHHYDPRLRDVSMHSYVLIGKDDAKVHLIPRDAAHTDHFSELIKDVKDVGKPYAFALRLPHASENDLRHIEVYAGVRSDLRSNDHNKYLMIGSYVSRLNNAELVGLVKSARLLFCNESVPSYLLFSLCDRMEQSEDKTFPYSQLPRKVQDTMLKVLMERPGFAEKYRKAPKYWS